MRIVSCGQKHTVAVVANRSSNPDEAEKGTSDVEVYAWGRLRQSEGGVDEVAHEPVRIGIFSGRNVTMVACGAVHTAAVTTCGRLYTWGVGANGRLGHGDTDDVWVPRPIRERSFRGRSIVVLAACGNCHTASVDEEGRLYTWGSNTRGALGIGAAEAICQARLTPCEIDSFKPGVRIWGVALGSRHSACVARDGDVYTWSVILAAHPYMAYSSRPSVPYLMESMDDTMGRGDGQKGQLGHGQWESLTSKGRLLNKAFPGIRTFRNEETLTRNPKPLILKRKPNIRNTDKAIPELLDFRPLRRCALQVSCGDAHSAVVTRLGQVYTFGCGSAGRLGFGDKVTRELLLPCSARNCEQRILTAIIALMQLTRELVLR